MRLQELQHGLGDSCGSNPCTAGDFLFPWSMGAPCAAYIACVPSGIAPQPNLDQIPSLVPDVGQSGAGGEDTSESADGTANYQPLILAAVAVVGVIMFLKK